MPSANSKLNFFQSLVYCKSFDVIAVTETWLSGVTSSTEILPSGYQVNRRDRPHTKGGVLITVSSCIPSSLVFCAPDIELIVVKPDSSSPILLCCVYLPPKCAESTIITFFSHLSSLSFCGPLLLIGDFNLLDIDWSSLTADTPPSRLFCNSLFSHNLVQLIHSPTHSHGNILDLIVTSHPEIISQVIVGDAACCSVSDHSLVSVSVVHSYSFSRRKSSYIYKYQDADVDGIDSYFSTLIVPLLLQSDVEAAWTFVKSSILAARDLFVPRVFVPASSLPQWFDAELRHELHQFRSLRRRVFKASSPTDYLLPSFIIWNPSFSFILAGHGERYLLHISSQFFLQPKSLFSHLRSLTKFSTILQTVSMGSCSASDPIGKATLFNSYFNSIFTVSDFVLPPLQSLPSPSSQLHHYFNFLV